MDIQEFKTQYYFFQPEMYGNIYAFVDFGNVRPWAKDFWPDENRFRFCSEVDIKKLSEVCDWVKPKRKFFYYGHFAKRNDLDINHRLNVRHRSSFFRIDKALKSGFLTKTKEVKVISQYDEDGKFLGKLPKCNFDVEITMDMLMKINKYDSVMLFSGDSDFGELLSYLKNKDKKIIVICTRSRMSKELWRVADKFIPAESLRNFLKYENKKTLSRNKSGEDRNTNLLSFR
ncbi:NYN domain-containing protein [Patescibacteria group bacterium]|nr:NYN domain-containing protein [Candidatus Falkowbacteria bacterium]MBU3905665.1 NYN domain-containing protein [Patescibacteria group bacterium]MBU4014759.1 NYN domain-containing protein [Patescibacteria group bacterium]MBU4026519.1 NYN domain-containing protein [Patescibacteria group bacterium]MBU4073033.1 NYN domain-containing protein [Patescibacteria group bacterium]